MPGARPVALAGKSARNCTVWVAASTVGRVCKRLGVIHCCAAGKPGTSARGKGPACICKATVCGTAAVMRRADGS